MGLFDKFVKTVKSAGKAVEKATKKVESTVVDAAEDVGEFVVDGAKDIGEFGKDYIDGLKKEANSLKNVVFGKEDKYKAKLESFLRQHRTEIKTLGAEVEVLSKEKGSSSPQNKVSFMVQDRAPAQQAEPAMQQLGATSRVQKMNKEARKIGKFQTWSFQLGGEINALLGASFNVGYATPIFKDSPHSISSLTSGDIDAGAQLGIGGGLAWGWWVDPPHKLEGVSYLLSTSIAYYSGLGITGYWEPKTERFLGFTLEFFAGGVGIEAAGGLGFTSTNFSAI